MPPKKKQKKNAVTFFIENVLIPEKQQQGYQYRSGIAALIPEAIERFKLLPEHEKARYEEMARQHRERNKQSGDNQRRDNTGNLISERKDPREVMYQRRAMDRQMMRETFPTGPALLEAKIYVIGFQYMVEVVKSDSEVEYMPVEVGVVEWSMKNGISREFHRMINPGDIPLGYRFQFQEHSTETHRLTAENILEGDTNYRSLWMQLENFVQPDSTAGCLRVVYCLVHEHDKILGCLSWLHQRAMCGPDRFKVRFLQDLILELYMHQSKSISESSVMDMLTRSSFDYEPNTSCKLHEDLETTHCAVATPKRYTYAMSDALAVVYDYELTPRHLPTRCVGKQQYITIGPNQEQLVPDIRRPAGRGCSMEEPFASRDIRQFPSTNAGMGAGDGNGYSSSVSSPIPKAANVASPVSLRPPPPCRLPPPTFQSGPTDVVEDMRNLSVSASTPMINPRQVMPENTYRQLQGAGPAFYPPPPATVAWRNPSAGPTAQRCPVPPPATAAWRNPTPGEYAKSRSVPSLSSFYTAGGDNSDDDNFDAYSATTGTSSYVPSYGGTGLVPTAGRGTFPYGGAAPSEVSAGSFSTCSRGIGDGVGRGVGLGRGLYPIQQPGMAVGRSVMRPNDASVPPPPGFSGADGFF